MQKHLLQDTLKNVHRKYLTKHPLMKISYSLFCMLRPFFVCFQCTRQRYMPMQDTWKFAVYVIETTWTSSHFNQPYWASSRFHFLWSQSKQSMYGECLVCNMNSVEFSGDVDWQQEVSYHQWTKSVKTSTGNVGNSIYCVTVKVLQKSTVADLITAFKNSLHKVDGVRFSVVRWSEQ